MNSFHNKLSHIRHTSKNFRCVLLIRKGLYFFLIGYAGTPAHFKRDIYNLLKTKMSVNNWMRQILGFYPQTVGLTENWVG